MKDKKMKREGRQHGMVRLYQFLEPPSNPRPDSRYVNRFDSPSTAGLFTKVSSKPTNQSKFTGKCGRPKCAGCHDHPVCKSKPKAKGTQKVRSCDVVSSHRLVSWRVVDCKPGLKFVGFSATGVLDHLDSDYLDVDDDDDDDYVHEVYEESCELPHLDSVELEIASGAVDIKDHDAENRDDDEIEDMGFLDVEIVWPVDDEDWYLVSEIL